MRNRKNRGFPKAMIFIIILITVTVFSWKSCSYTNSEPEVGHNQHEHGYLTVQLDK